MQRMLYYKKIKNTSGLDFNLQYKVSFSTFVAYIPRLAETDVLFISEAHFVSFYSTWKRYFDLGLLSIVEETITSTEEVEEENTTKTKIKK